MSWNLVRLADLAPQPWKNGGGTTRELLAWPLYHARQDPAEASSA